MKALIIVDMQNDFLPDGSLAVENGNAIIPKINSIQAKYDLVVATQDWHPKNHKSFATQHPENKIFDQIILEGLYQTLWPEHCVQGTQGAEFSSLLNQNLIEAIFRKGMDENIDSYSGFFDNGKKKSTGLEEYLKAKKIKEIHVCGLAADFCVYYTAKDALDLGFKTSIIENATIAINPLNFNEIKINFQEKGGEIIQL
ncbi:bifunctional nicotinamidase/pyrazinamidase [Apibacter muscae]|uniref:bifunctional nicotinamidase/pyrazinamidase n=1 Tax=Apibacter muscae TaxID=2509004 RepID=UPI0011ACA786|nr:bifunctional nicotinamidase/pyrazinamidase [Apibacter muscae]TWP28142.1 bifunctional nicotinamidase/pyrazinamidase [Apibacter muscae]